MKKYFCLTISFFACFIFQCCILSEKAYYHEKDITDLPAVQGEWKAIENKRDSNQHLIIIKKDKIGKYTIIDKELNKANQQIRADTSKNVTLFKINDNYYFDNYKPVSTDSLKPVHFLEEIRLKKDKMDMLVISSKEMQKLIKTKKITLPYIQKEDGTIIFTASTNDLQNYLFLNNKNKNLFEKVGTLIKIK